MKYIRLTTVLLALLNGGLVVLVSFLWNGGQARVREPANLAVSPLTLPDLADSSSTSMRGVDVAAIRDQALFHAHRSFYRPPPPSMEIPPPEYVLAGTMGLQDGKRVAFVKKRSDQSTRTIHVGDELDGWRVQLVETARVIVVRDAQTAELLDTQHDPTHGLIHAAPAPRVTQTGPRVLGGTASGTSPTSVSSVSAQARTYQPPPH